MSTRTGFTLVELLIVLAVVGLLSGIIITALGDSRAKSRDADRQRVLNQVKSALELARSDDGIYPGVDGSTVYYAGCDTTTLTETYGSNAFVSDPTVLPTEHYALETGDTCYLYQRNTSGDGYRAYFKPETSTLEGGGHGCETDHYCLAVNWGVGGAVAGLADLALQLDTTYGYSPTGDYFHDWASLDEKWLAGANSVWHIILPDGGVYGMNGTDVSTRVLLAQLDASYWQNIDLLRAAVEGSGPPPNLTVLSDCDTTKAPDLAVLAEQLDTTHQFASASNYFLDHFGLNEKWIVTASGDWYFILDGGGFYKALSFEIDEAENRLCIDHFNYDYWQNPALITDAAS